MLLRKLDTGWPKRMIKWNTYEWYYQYAMGTRFKSMSYKTNTEYNINIGWCKHNLNVIQMSKKLVKFTILFLLPNQIEQTQKQNKTMLMSTMELYLYWMLHSLSKLGLIGDEGFHLPNKGLLCFCNYKTIETMHKGQFQIWLAFGQIWAFISWDQRAPWISSLVARHHSNTLT